MGAKSLLCRRSWIWPVVPLTSIAPWVIPISRYWFAFARAGVGGEADQFGAGEFDRAGFRFDEADDGFERGGFADAVAAHEADEAFLRHGEIHAAQDS